MRTTRSPGILLLALFLILYGVGGVFPAVSLGIIVPLVAVIAGIVILLGR